MFEREPTVIDINTQRAVVVGDLHGDVTTFRKIIECYPPEANTYVVMGDFVDRGDRCTELLAALLAYKLLFTKSFVILRGDHESPIGEVNPQQFPEEFMDRLGDEQTLKKIYEKLFPEMPLAVVLNQKYFVVHGGVPISAPKLSELRRLSKVFIPARNSETLQMMWNDPFNGNGSFGSRRGSGIYEFGKDVAESFLQKNGLELIIRGHEHGLGGYRLENKILTLLTTTAYPGDRQYIATLEDGALEIVDVSGRPPVRLRGIQDREP